MRKIIAAEFMSLDGVFEAPDTWHSQFVDGEVGQAMMAQMAGWDSLLLGRRTYEGFAEAWPSRSSADFGPIADFMNNSPKYVVSTTLKGADWSNTTLIGSHPRQAVEDLKRKDGGDIAILGSSTLLQFLLAERLVDQLQVVVDPILVGKGKRLFNDGSESLPLRLVHSRLCSNGVAFLDYEPVRD
jgi:dihydrofolate reductase